MNLKLTLRAVTYFEKFTGRSFYQLEQTLEDLGVLIYCVLLAHPENQANKTYEDSKEFITQHFAEYAVLLEKQTLVTNQFVGKLAHLVEDTTQDSSTAEPVEPIFITKILPMLTQGCNLDIHYVLDEMNLDDIDMYVEYYVNEERKKMVETRSWVYLLIAPHIDSKKIKGPEDLMEFSWEKDAKKKAFDPDKVKKILQAKGVIKTEEGTTE